MTKTVFALLLAAVMMLSACVPQRGTYESASPAAQTPRESAAAVPATPGDTPIPSEEPAAAAPGYGLPDTYADARVIDDPGELGLYGSLSWIWENSITRPGKLAAMYSMCAAVTGKDKNGRDCIYAAQVYDIGKSPPLYMAGDEYPRIDSVSGSKFSVYFIEHNGEKWRLLYLPMDSEADIARVIDEGEGLIPELSEHTETTLAYVVQTGDTYAVRVCEKIWDDGSVGILGEIPLPDAPLDPSREYYHDVFTGVTYARKVQEGYAIVTQDVEGESANYYIRERPVCPQSNEMGIAWLDESGRLFFWLRATGKTFLLSEDVDWYDLNDGILYATQGGTRLMYAHQPLEDGEILGEIGCIVLAQGDWKYLDGITFTLGEKYACVLREREGRAQFAGMELTLIPGE